jgi:hypothetical protein
VLGKIDGLLVFVIVFDDFGEILGKKVAVGVTI